MVAVVDRALDRRDEWRLEEAADRRAHELPLSERTSGPQGGRRDRTALDQHDRCLEGDGDRVAADQHKLCDALVVSGEVEGEDKAFMGARRALFGCPDQALWISEIRLPDDLGNFLDSSATEPDELVRLARVIDRSHFVFATRDSNFERGVVGYAIDQIDYKGLSAQRVLAELDQPPYKGNTYAQTVALESLGRARLAIKAVEVEVQSRSTDADWKAALVTAPQQAIDQWTQLAARTKDGGQGLLAAAPCGLRRGSRDEQARDHRGRRSGDVRTRSQPAIRPARGVRECRSPRR